MSADEKNRLLGIGYIVLGAVQVAGSLILAMYFAFFFGLISRLPGSSDDFFTPMFPFFVFVVALVFYGLLTGGGSIFTGVGLLKKRGWARPLAFVMGALYALRVPLGTALAIFTFWFLLGESGKALYEERREESGSQAPRLNEPPSRVWREEEQKRERERVEPPDWRI